MIHPSDLIQIGQMSKTHGTQGEVACLLSRDIPEDMELSLVMLLVDNIPVPFYVDDWRYKTDDVLLLKLEDVDTEAAAKRLIGCKVYLEKRMFGQEQADSLTWQELKGYVVVEQSHGKIGVISEVDETTINTLFLLDSGVVIPAHEDFIVSIDTKKSEITLALPEGLF